MNIGNVNINEGWVKTFESKIEAIEAISSTWPIITKKDIVEALDNAKIIFNANDRQPNTVIREQHDTKRNRGDVKPKP